MSLGVTSLDCLFRNSNKHIFTTNEPDRGLRFEGTKPTECLSVDFDTCQIQGFSVKQTEKGVSLNPKQLSADDINSMFQHSRELIFHSS